jgi:glycosyltransferase involved in cell wall biosynthesis
MTRPPTISAAIITLNEQRNLAELLPRLTWLDEIVVVDGGSDDGTCDVASSFGCRVSSRPFRSFAEQRNAAIDAAGGDWILSIDADERPSPRLAREIGRRVGDRRYAAHRLPIRSTIFGRRFRACGTQKDRPVRLFRRGAARWVGEVHEVLRVDGRIGTLDQWLEHRTLDNLHVFFAKINRYTELEARARVARGNPPRRGGRWLAAAREVFRRLVWNYGIVDGPAGWTFCALSGLSEWVLARRHQELWQAEGSRYA